MCCPFDKIPVNFTPTGLAIEGGKGEKVCYVKGVIDRSPKTLGDRFVRFFQSLEWIEKIAEIADESFHLLGTFFQQYAPQQVYHSLQNLHHNAHDIEHLLHAACFFGDLSRLLTGKFLEYSDAERKQIHYLRSTARVCHAVSHFFATTAFLTEQRLISLGKLENFAALRSLFSILGYGIMAISLIWDRCKREVKGDAFGSDLVIHVSGLLFESVPYLKKLKPLASLSSVIGKAGALAGIVHAWLVAQRLGSKDREEVIGSFILPTKNLQDSYQKCDHEHGHNDHHDHIHKFISVKQAVR